MKVDYCFFCFCFNSPQNIRKKRNTPHDPDGYGRADNEPLRRGRRYIEIEYNINGDKKIRQVQRVNTEIEAATIRYWGI